MNLRVLAEARAEVIEAVDWYASRDDYGEWAERFLGELERAKRLVREQPGAWPEVEPGVRRFVFRRFPFSLIYTVKPDGVLVLAVAHHSRRVNYWRERG